MGRYNIPARAHGGRMVGPPRLLVVHSAETPLRAGYAKSLAVAWFGALGAATTSAHKIVDPRDVVVMVPETVVAWHCGNGNRRSLGYEQSGYASYSRAQWTTPDGMRQMRLLAGELAADAEQWDIPLRWATLEQIRDAHATGAPGGLATHNDMRLAVGGTTHRDPGGNYPRSLLLDMARDSSDPAAYAKPRRLPHQVPWGPNAEFRLTEGRQGPRADALNAALGLGGNRVSDKTLDAAEAALRRHGMTAELARLKATGGVGRGIYVKFAAITRKGSRP